MPSAPTHLFLDFFGTVVEYTASRTTQDFRRTHALTTRLGSRLDYAASVSTWGAAFGDFDAHSAITGREFAMVDVTRVALTTILDREPTPDEVTVCTQSYLADWNQGVHYPEGMREVLQDLRSRYTLAIVSNTFHVGFVEDHLSRMGAADLIEPVITSIDVGWCKPHPAIFDAALDSCGITADQALFVGDTFDADFEGPQTRGISAFLISATDDERVPEHRRITSLNELSARLTALGLP